MCGVSARTRRSSRSAVSSRVEPAVLGPDLLGVGHAGVRLVAEGGLEVERLHEQLAAERREPRGRGEP